MYSNHIILTWVWGCLLVVPIVFSFIVPEKESEFGLHLPTQDAFNSLFDLSDECIPLVLKDGSITSSKKFAKPDSNRLRKLYARDCKSSTNACMDGDPTGDCDSPIYCHGPIIDTIQRAGLYKDSKTFIDMPTSKPLAQVVESFYKLPKNVSKEELKAFIRDNFVSAETALQSANLTEWKPDPTFLNKLSPTLKSFGADVHSVWKQLIRTANPLPCDGCVSSLLNVSKTFVVPGGRFREFYYWDNFFALEGLLLSELEGISRSSIDTFLGLIDSYGFVPNGPRAYYMNR